MTHPVTTKKSGGCQWSTVSASSAKDITPKRCTVAVSSFSPSASINQAYPKRFHDANASSTHLPGFISRWTKLDWHVELKKYQKSSSTSWDIDWNIFSSAKCNTYVTMRRISKKVGGSVGPVGPLKLGLYSYTSHWSWCSRIWCKNWDLRRIWSPYHTGQSLR